MTRPTSTDADDEARLEHFAGYGRVVEWLARDIEAERDKERQAVTHKDFEIGDIDDDE
jgi:hypothetical protein